MSRHVAVLVCLTGLILAPNAGAAWGGEVCTPNQEVCAHVGQPSTTSAEAYAFTQDGSYAYAYADAGDRPEVYVAAVVADVGYAEAYAASYRPGEAWIYVAAAAAGECHYFYAHVPPPPDPSLFEC